MNSAARTAVLPTLRESLPEWGAHADKVTALHAQLEVTEGQARALCVQLAAVGEWHIQAVSQSPQPAPEPALSERARELLGPDFVAEPAPIRRAAERPRSQMRQRYDDLLQEIAALQAAIAALERPRDGRGNAETRSGQLLHLANRRRFDGVEPALRVAELHYLRALTELARAMSTYGQLLKELRSVAVSVSFRASPLPTTLGDPTDAQSEIRRILRFGIECNRIGVSDLPGEWQETRSTVFPRSAMKRAEPR